jgi:transcriptional antiterminator NusG
VTEQDFPKADAETEPSSAVADAWAAAVARADESAIEDAAHDAVIEAPAPAQDPFAVAEPAVDDVEVDEVIIVSADSVIDDESFVASDGSVVEVIDVVQVDDDGVMEEMVAVVETPAVTDEDEDPEEAFRRAMQLAPGDWYVLHSYAGFENRVRTNLESRITTMNMEDEIFQVEVPVEEVTEVKNGVRKQIKRNKFPGYVLVRMDLTDQSWGVVRHTPGVTGFVGHAHQPSPLTLDEVVNILAPKSEKKTTAAAAAAAAATVDFEVGDPVTIIEGAFGTMQATIAEISPESQKVIVMVELFGRETPVELTFAQIEKG